ncbi:MAG: hypothetical protein JXR27_11545 [Paludibacteraceae bacterium]|nr:hypothetical protein [Paludibacteraceae bacterium]
MAERRLIRLIGYLFTKLKSFLFSKDVLSFLSFLVLSAGFWFVNALDKERDTEISIPIRYAGVPQHIAITNNPADAITLKVRDQGVNLFAYSRRKLTPVVFEIQRNFYEKGRIHISPDQIRGKLTRYLRPTTTILEIKPDSLVLNYEKLSTAILPVELDADIRPAQQYILSEKIQLNPDHITVFAPARILNKLTSLKTERIELRNVNDTLFKTLNIVPIENVRFSANETKVSIFVEMFTEKQIQLPLTIINQPENVIIRTFPAFINLTFNVGLSHFKSIKPGDLKAVFDYSNLKKGENKQRIQILNKANYISNLRFTPQEVEYLIEIN